MSSRSSIAAGHSSRDERRHRRSTVAGTPIFIALIIGAIWPWFLSAPTPGAGRAAAADLQSSRWLAEEVDGTVLVRAAGEGASGWQALAATMPIAAHSEISTGSDGMAVLANGVDRIELAPNSRITLPAEEGGLLTLIRQQFGRVLFDVGPRTEERFEVDARYLVVLVKGTKFVVRVNYISSSVEVREGTVEARARKRLGRGTAVGAGQTARVTAGSSTITLSATDSSGAGQPGQGKGGPTDPPAPPSFPKSVPEPEPEPEPEPRETPDGPGGDDDGGSSGSSGGGDNAGHGNDDDHDDPDNPGQGGGDPGCAGCGSDDDNDNGQNDGNDNDNGPNGGGGQNGGNSSGGQN